MSITAEKKQQTITKYRRQEQDTGSPEVQIALLTERINALTGHLKTQKQDHSSRRGLLTMVSTRTSLLKYLARTNRDAYQTLIGELGLRK